MSANILNVRKVYLHYENKNITVILESINKETDFSFFYNKSIGIEKKSTYIMVKNMELHSALSYLFAGLPYDFQISNRTIVITEVKDQNIKHWVITVKEINDFSLQTIPSIRGRLLDSLGNPVSAV